MTKLLSLIKKPISISRNFTIFFVYFSIFTLLLSLGLFFRHYQRSRNVINQKLEYQSGRIESVFVDAIEYTQHSMNFIGKQIVDNQKQDDYQFISHLLSSYRVPDNKIMEYSTFSWADENHRLVVSSNKGLHFDQVLDLSVRDYIPRTVSNPLQIHLGKPVFGIYSQKYSIPAGYGVIDKNGKYLGAVVTSFVIGGLQRKFDETINVDGVSFVLIQKDGLFIAGSPKINFEDIKNQLTSFLPKTTENKEGTLYNAGFFNNKNFGSIYYDNLENYPYIILTIYNKELQKAEIYDMIFSHIAIFAALFSLISILLLLFYQNLIKPIIILSEAARKISNGEYKDIHLGRFGIIEVNQLSKSILSIKHFVKTEQDLRSQLDVSNKKLHSLLKSISHDLRNYISGTSGLAEIIIEELANKELEEKNKQTEECKNHITYLAQLIIKQSNRMFDFTKDILNTDITELGVIKLDDAEDFDVKELIEEMLILNQHFVKDQQVSIIANFEANLPTLKCDRRRFRQVIDNLITNAIKYSKKGGEVKIGVGVVNYKNQQNIYITIQDNGIGMTKKDIESALEGRGKDIDKSDLDKPIDSHGIGMQIVVQVINAIGAKMNIESEKRRGTTVKLWFNISDKKTNNSKTANDEESILCTKISEDLEETKTKKSSKIILIADDEEINLMILERVLLVTKHKIIKARDGKEVLEILNQQECDLIFIDIKMPEIDGLEVAKQIRSGKLKNKKHQFVPIVAVSGNDDTQSKKKALQSGIDKVIGKPFVKKEVLDLVKELLG